MLEPDQPKTSFSYLLLFSSSRLIAQAMALNSPHYVMKFMQKTRHLASWNFQYNLTDYGHKIVEAITTMSNLSFTSGLNAVWVQNVAVPRAKILMYNGYAMSFNLVEYLELFEDEK